MRNGYRASASARAIVPGSNRRGTSTRPPTSSMWARPSLYPVLWKSGHTTAVALSEPDWKIWANIAAFRTSDAFRIMTPRGAPVVPDVEQMTPISSGAPPSRRARGPAAGGRAQLGRRDGPAPVALGEPPEVRRVADDRRRIEVAERTVEVARGVAGVERDGDGAVRDRAQIGDDPPARCCRRAGPPGRRGDARVAGAAPGTAPPRPPSRRTWRADRGRARSRKTASGVRSAQWNRNSGRVSAIASRVGCQHSRDATDPNQSAIPADVVPKRRTGRLGVAPPRAQGREGVDALGRDRMLLEPEGPGILGRVAEPLAG